MTKKIPDELDDPVDNLFYKLCDKLSPYFKKTNHTPNIITTYSLLTGLLSCYALYKNNIILFIIFFIISYFFDCFDGFFARKYGMTSKFGDYYDHIKDAFVYIVLIFIIFYKYSMAITPINIIIMVILFILFTSHMGCQQSYYKDKNKNVDGETVDFYQKMCRNKEDLKYTRFFGPGMLTIFSTLMITFIWSKYKKL
jgi:phosphatidylglycerophosphate synthase